MTDAIFGKRYGALYAWPDGDDWFYLPEAPSPQRTAEGRAQLTAVDTGGMLMITLGASLSASEQQLAEAQAAIAAELGRGAVPVRLRPASATPRAATLTFTPEGGAPVELARAHPSALPPYSAAFSAMLRGDQASEVSAAMKGGTGRLEIIYDLDLSTTRAVTARIEGDPGETEDVEAALAAGKLTLSIDADPGTSDRLKADARQRVIDEASRLFALLPRRTAKSPPFSDCAGEADPVRNATLDDPDASTTTTTVSVIDAHVTRTEPAPRAVRVSANVADWL
jgi:hypothetical protein